MLEVKDKAAARKFTRAAQVLFVVAGGAAGAIALVGGPRSVASSADSYRPKEVALQLGGEKAAVDLDLGGASARLNLVGNAPRPVPPPEVNREPESVKPDEAKTASTPPVNADVIQYLGPVRLGGKTLALLSIHGKQRFAGLEDTTDDGVVTEITAEHVTLTLRDVSRKVDRAARGGEVVTRVTGGSAAKGQPIRTASGAIRNPVAAPMAQPTITPARPVPMPDPSVRYEDIRVRLKGTGMYQNEEDLATAAKQELERQIMNGKPPEKGGK